MSEQRPRPYEFDDLPLSAVDPGSSVLVSGDPMSGAGDLALELVLSAADHGEGMILISPDDAGDAVLADCEAARPDLDPTNLRVIDCSGQPSGAVSPSVETVSDPSDLTGIGIRYSGLYESLYEVGVDRVRTGVTAVSVLLMYSDLRTVFRFLHTLVGRIASADGLGVFVLDPSTHDEQTVSTVTRTFDGRIEVRTEDGDRQLRVRGLSDQPAEWTDF